MGALENRRSERYEIIYPVEIRTTKNTFSGRLRDLSATGAGLDRTFVQLQTGEKIVLDADEKGIFQGRVQWQSTSGFGVEFDLTTQRGYELSKLLKELKAAAKSAAAA